MNNKTIFINRYFFPDHSATSQLLSDLVFSLGPDAQPVEVLTTRQRYGDASAVLQRKELIKGVQVRRLWTSRFGRHWLPGRAIDYLTFYLRAALWLLKHVNKGDTVVAKTDPPLMSVVAAIIVRLKGGRLVTWNQDVFPEIATALGIKALNGNFGRLLKHWRNWSWRMADVNVVLGQRMEHILLSQNVPDEHIRIINNWSIGEAIKPIARSQNTISQEWNLQDKFVVGYSGNMGRVHEFETILTAAQQLNSHDDIVFLFIGHGPKRAEFEEQVKRLELENVIFKPYQPEERLPYSLGLPDVHLISQWPSMEGLVFPSKFYGITAAGRPTVFIGDPQGEIALELERHQCGVAVNIGDGEGLANTILNMQKDSGWRQSMGVNARHAYDTQYDRSFAIEAWREILAAPVH